LGNIELRIKRRDSENREVETIELSVDEIDWKGSWLGRSK
jgi:hypothetical protein